MMGRLADVISDVIVGRQVACCLVVMSVITMTSQHRGMTSHHVTTDRRIREDFETVVTWLQVVHCMKISVYPLMFCG